MNERNINLEMMKHEKVSYKVSVFTLDHSTTYTMYTLQTNAPYI